ncbi:MAG: FHA domain-containing protein [Actinomycetia bacterium]|nr:FHA domain-containing protein [Actinomycetes bacterium]
MVQCGACGYQNPAGANFCAGCGVKLPGASPTGDTTHVIPLVEDDAHGADVNADVAAAVSELPDDQALLVVTRGSQAGERYLLEAGTTTAGRAVDCDIFLDDITVSRRHAVFTLEHGTVSVRDLGSLNGTYVNRDLLEGPTVLRDDDEVQIGKFRMVLRTPGRP